MCNFLQSKFQGKKNKIIVLVAGLLTFISSSVYAQTLYWVGGTGNWNDPAHWSTTSGGAGGAGKPDQKTDVVFDAYSFTAAGQTMTLSGVAACHNITWLDQNGKNPRLIMPAKSIWSVYGSLTLHQSMKLQLSNSNERIEFVSALGTQTITSTGQILPEIRFNSVTGIWNLADDLKVGAAQVWLQAGTLNTMGKALTCAFFNANSASARTVNLSNSILTLTGVSTSTPVFDLWGDNLTWVTPGEDALIKLTNGSMHWIVSTILVIGPGGKTIPDLLFEGPRRISIQTANTTNRIIFREIEVTTASGSSLSVIGKSPKTYSESIILPDNFNAGNPEERTFEGTNDPAPNNNIFQGAVSIGRKAGVIFKGNNTFQKSVTIREAQSNAVAVQFTDDCAFEDVVDITGQSFVLPYRQANVSFANSTFNNDVFLRGNDAIFRFGGSVKQKAEQTFYLMDNTKAMFTGNLVSTISSGMKAGSSSCIFNGTLSLGTRSEATFINSASNLFTHIVADRLSVVGFTPMPATTNAVTGKVTLAGSCAGLVTINSGINGLQAKVTFSNKQDWTATAVQDVSIMTGSQPVQVTSGVDNGNNTGIAFKAGASNPVMYWVGGDPANASGNNLWSDPRNWAADVNDPLQRVNGSSCIPDATTHVIFERRSFSNGSAKYTQVQVDVPLAFCHNMTWTDDVNGNTGGVLPRLTTTSPLNTIQVMGNLQFAPPIAMENYFTGAFEFAASGPATIDANGAANAPAVTPVTRFNGHVIFSGRRGKWQLESDLLVNGSNLGTFVFEYGNVSVIDSEGNSRNITLDGNWLVRRPQDGGLQATVDLGSGTVTFNGDLTNKDSQYIISGPPVAPHLNDFYNLVINREYNGYPNDKVDGRYSNVVLWGRYDNTVTPGTVSGLPDPNTPYNTGITVRNNLTVLRGSLFDNGFQIIGNSTGRLTVANGAHLLLGSSVWSGAANNSPMTTRFPTGFTRSTIDLQPGSTIVYRANGHQDVSDIPVYSNLYHYSEFGALPSEISLAHLTMTSTVKRLAMGPLQINGKLTISPGILMADNGFQISGTSGTSSMQMFAGGTLVLGSSAMNVATSYGTGADPSVNKTGYLSVGAVNSQFPLNFDSERLELSLTSTIIYNGGDTTSAQKVKGLSGFGTYGAKHYGHLVFTNTNPAPARMVDKQLTGPVQVQCLLFVYPNTQVVDQGFQITGTTNDQRSLLTMYSSNATDIPDLRQQSVTSKHALTGPSQLVVGSAGSASEFPALFPNRSITLQPNTTVVYNSGQPVQKVRRLSGSIASQNYARLVIRNPNGTLPMAIKYIDNSAVADGSKSLTIQENLTVESFADFQDAGYQIRRRTAGGVLGIQANGQLTIGTVSTVAAPAIANTSFPMLFDVSALNLDVTSTVRYNAGANFKQTIAALQSGGNATYGNLVLSNADTTLTAKPLQTSRQFIAPTTVRRDFQVLSAVSAFDQGFQITGSGMGKMTMDKNAMLYLGDTNAGNSASQFPLNYPTSRISLNDSSVVHYNDFASPQLISIEPANYGILRLGSASGANPPDHSPYQRKILTRSMSEKSSVGIRTHLQINPDCELKDNGFQLEGYSGLTFVTLASNTWLGIGNATAATQFPLNVDQTRINLDRNSTVEYSAGDAATGAPQLIRDLFHASSLSSNQNYANLVLTNTSASRFTEKQLAGNIRIRGGLTIHALSELNVGPASYNINIQGDWTCLGGRFVAGSSTGTVTFEGENNQTVRTCSVEPYLTEPSQDFQQVIFDKQNRSNLITLASRFGVKSGAQFKTGLVVSAGLNAPFSTSPAQVMIFRDHATATGASDNSLVIGAVRKVGRCAGIFYFPIGVSNGSESTYRPSGITSPLAADAAFLSQYFPQNPGDYGFHTGTMQKSVQCSSFPLEKVNAREFWIINRENRTDNVFVSLTWREVKAGPDPYQLLRVSRWNGALWQNMGGRAYDSYLGTLNTNYGTVQSAYNNSGCSGAVDNFSPFALGWEEMSNPLPADIIAFKARLTDGSVQLNWQVTSEKQVVRYIVQRSKTAAFHVADVVVTDTVSSKGDNWLMYQSMDEQPLPGESYYRLQIQDEDGSVAYSKIISIKSDPGDTNDISLYPNPSDGRSIQLSSEQELTVMDISDLMGRKLPFQVNKNASQTMKITFAQRLASGIYLVTVRGLKETQLTTMKFIVR